MVRGKREKEKTERSLKERKKRKSTVFHSTKTRTEFIWRHSFAWRWYLTVGRNHSTCLHSFVISSVYYFCLNLRHRFEIELKLGRLSYRNKCFGCRRGIKRWSACSVSDWWIGPKCTELDRHLDDRLCLWKHRKRKRSIVAEREVPSDWLVGKSVLGQNTAFVTGAVFWDISDATDIVDIRDVLKWRRIEMERTSFTLSFTSPVQWMALAPSLLTHPLFL